MADLAVLGLEVRSQDVERANRELDKMSGAAKRAEAAAKGLGTNGSNAARQVAAANDNLAQSYSRVGGAVSRLTTVVAGLASLGFVALVGASISLGKELLTIERTAKLAGLSLRDLQTIQQAGAQVGVSAEDVNRGAVGIAKALNEARREENDLTRLLDANNIKWKDREGNVIGVNEALTIAADLISRAGTELDKLDIAKKLSIPESLIPLLENGAGQFLTMRNNAAEAGKIIDDQIIQKAKEFDEAWTRVTANIVASWKAGVADMASDWSETISSMITRASDLARSIRAAVAPGMAATAAGSSVGAALGLGATQPFGTLPTTFNAGPTDPELQRRLLRIHNQQTVIKPPEKPASGFSGGGGLSEEDQRYNQVVRYIERLEMAGRILQAEVDTIGKSNAERQKAIELARIGTVTDTEQLSIIDKQVEKNEQLRVKLEQIKQAREGAFDAATFGGNLLIDSLDSAIMQGRELSEVFRNVGQAIFKAGLQALILGQGPLAGVLGLSSGTNKPGGFIGGALSDFGFASGGYTGNGPRNAAAGVVHGQEFVFSAAATRRIGVGNLDALHRRAKGYADGGFVSPAPMQDNTPRRSAAPVSVSPVYNIDARGAQIGVAEQISAVVRENNRQLLRQIHELSQVSQRRYA
jgi:hypothetical protein